MMDEEEISEPTGPLAFALPDEENESMEEDDFALGEEEEEEYS